MPPEIMQLLATASGLIHAHESAVTETVRIADTDFRLITKRHGRQGWIVVLMQQPDRTPCDYTLQSLFGLTDREVEVARLLMDRLTKREIAERLGVAMSTAGRHTENVMKKIGVASRKEVRAKVLGCLAAS